MENPSAYTQLVILTRTQKYPDGHTRIFSIFFIGFLAVDKANRLDSKHRNKN